MDWPLRFGIFLAPFHPYGQDPNLALHRDLELIEHLDRIGMHEAWIGEHHSAGFEIISSPEVFIAAAAERTRNIRLGTGVVSLAYHHPFMVAQRMILLDHLTRGRAMLGVGPGSLISDAWMMGIDPATQRDRMEESLEAIMALFRGDKKVTQIADWFELHDAQLQPAPYSHPHPEVAVAAMISPSGPRAAGRFGCSLLSIGATQRQGIDLLGQTWSIYDEISRENGHDPNRRAWRLLTQMHLAETREEAKRDVEHGLPQFGDYFARIANLPLVPEGDGPIADRMISTRAAVIGTPDDAIEFVDHLIEQSNGGFGTLLLMGHEWANPAATKRSHELFMQYVAPRFTGSGARQTASADWVAENRSTFSAQFGGAIMGAFQKHQADRAEKSASS